MYKTKHFFKFSPILLITAIIFFLPSMVMAKTQPYYSGDAINFHNQVIIGSTDMGYCQIFKLDNQELVGTADLKVSEDSANGKGQLSGLIFNEENKHLYLYLIGGTYIYKYNLDDVSSPVLVKQIHNTNWDWFLSVGKSGNKIITTGNKEIKIWSQDLEIVDTYNIANDYYNNIYLDSVNNNLFRVKAGELNLYNSQSRQITSSLAIEATAKERKNFYNDQTAQSIYLVDNGALKQISYRNGLALANEFKHISNVGYDAAGIDGENYLYFSDGLGVVKIEKDTLKPLSWVYTSRIVSNGWAMGLKAVPSIDGDRVVVFNNDYLLVLDEDLNLITSKQSTAQAADPVKTEALALSITSDKAPVGTEFILNGRGFGSGEDITISFAGTKKVLKAENNGRFSVKMTVPDVDPGMVDIKATGNTTNLSYSFSFKIE